MVKSWLLAISGWTMMAFGQHCRLSAHPLVNAWLFLQMTDLVDDDGGAIALPTCLQVNQGLACLGVSIGRMRLLL